MGRAAAGKAGAKAGHCGAVRGGAVPKRTAARATDWTPAMAELFAGALADSCNVTLSARAVGRSVSSVYRHRARDASFRAGWDQALAIGYSRLEMFIVPVEGMRLSERVSGLELAFRGGSWTSGSMRVAEVLVAGAKVLGGRQPAIADAAGGSVVDSQARAAVAQILSALRSHGLIAP